MRKVMKKVMKKVIAAVCVMVFLMGPVWSNPVPVNAAVTESGTACVVTEKTVSGLTVISGMEGVRIESYANKGDYILAYGSSTKDDGSYLFVLNNGKLVKKYTLKQLLAKTTLKDTECNTLRLQYINNHFYVMISGITSSNGKATYNAYCQALVTDDGLKFTMQSMPAYKIPNSQEYYPCGLLTKMGAYYIYTPGSSVLADSSGKISYYISKNLKTWTKYTTIKLSAPTSGEYEGNDIVWSIAAATDEGIYFKADSLCWMGVSKHSYTEIYVTSNFKTYTRVTGLAKTKDTIYYLKKISEYGKNAVLAVQRPMPGYEELTADEDICSFFIATDLGKFKEKAEVKTTDSTYNWLNGGNKMVVIIAESDGCNYIYCSTDNGENFMRYQLDSLLSNSFNAGRMLISSDKTAYIAYGENGIVSSEDGFRTITKTVIDGNILGAMETDSANYIITDAGVCRLTDDEMDTLFR